jgi:predicted AlkP superfamily phosphohydrolase/phosphomutase
VRRGYTRLWKKKGASHGFGIQVDWKRTRAFMPFHSCTGFVYVNLEGRQPQGSVVAGDLQRVRDDVIAALRAFRDPKTRANYFQDVSPLVAQSEVLNLPDIFVQPAPGVEFVRKAKAGEFAFPTKRPFAGIHEPDGLYILHGPNVRAQRDTHAQIVDMAPTILAMCGEAVPSYMEGRALSECFAEPLTVTTVPFAWEAREAGDAYTAEGAAAVEKRLADLGYLD